MRWLLLAALAFGGLTASCEYTPPERNEYGETDAFGPGEFPMPREEPGEPEGVQEGQPEEPYRGE